MNTKYIDLRFHSDTFGQEVTAQANDVVIHQLESDIYFGVSKTQKNTIFLKAGTWVVTSDKKRFC